MPTFQKGNESKMSNNGNQNPSDGKESATSLIELNRSDFVSDQEVRKRLEREAKAVSSLNIRFKERKRTRSIRE